jgi:cation transport ATPase
MELIKLQTNINCNGCVADITPHLDEQENIEQWQVDTSDDKKPLSIEGSISMDEAIKLVKHAGYDAKPWNGSESFQTQPVQTGFWSDGPKWKRAGFNTLNCLIGCSIGDFGMIIFLQAFYPGTSMFWQMILAIIAGLCTSIALETAIMRFREGFDWRNALTTALSMSFLSMVAMEIAMNITDFMVTGGKGDFDDPMYWVAFGYAAVAGFITPLPYNYWRLKKFNQACH